MLLASSRVGTSASPLRPVWSVDVSSAKQATHRCVSPATEGSCWPLEEPLASPLPAYLDSTTTLGQKLVSAITEPSLAEANVWSVMESPVERVTVEVALGVGIDTISVAASACHALTTAGGAPMESTAEDASGATPNLKAYATPQVPPSHQPSSPIQEGCWCLTIPSTTLRVPQTAAVKPTGSVPRRMFGMCCRAEQQTGVQRALRWVRNP